MDFHFKELYVSTKRKKDNIQFVNGEKATRFTVNYKLISKILNCFTTDILSKEEAEHVIMRVGVVKLCVKKHKQQLDIRIWRRVGDKYIPSRKGFGFHVKDLPKIVTILERIVQFNTGVC